MREWQTYFKKVGGIKYLYQLFNSGTLLVGSSQFLILGHSKKALEILRLSISNKFYRSLCKSYKSTVHDLLKRIDTSETAANISNKTIWICWWQGIEQAPKLVKRCITSVKNNLIDWDIQIITRDNYRKYVDFPDFILKKWEAGLITNTHMSDILRLELLIKHGGLWLDSTVLCTSGNIPKSIIESDLFFFQCLKPGADGHTIPLSSWLIYSKSNNNILRLTRDLLYVYWQKNNKLKDYFLLHHFMTIACESFPEEYEKIPQFCNSIPHILLLNLFKKFNSVYWNDLTHMSCFHKLTYKFDSNKLRKCEGSYYEWINSQFPYE